MGRDDGRGPCFKLNFRSLLRLDTIYQNLFNRVTLSLASGTPVRAANRVETILRTP